MDINRANLDNLFTGFSTAFNGAMEAAKPQHDRVAMTVPSSTKKLTYAWLGKIPGFRQWVGDRVIQNISNQTWTVENVPYENTIGVDRDDIEDDQYGVYAPLFSEMGFATAQHPSETLFALLASGFTTACYDGQFFIDTDHPVIDINGVTQSVSNDGGGGGTAWYLLATKRMVKPLIWQARKPYNFVRMDNETDENVFMRKEFIYGVDARAAAAFGLWQLAYGSQDTLNIANYATARAAMMALYADGGKKLGIVPDLLVVPPSLEKEALEVIQDERQANGATNTYRGTAEVLVSPYLS